jgi:hypothetical protein
MHTNNDSDSWSYIWGSRNYSSQKAYKHFIESTDVHPVFNWIWASSSQMKHKVFYWLLSKNSLNTRGLHSSEQKTYIWTLMCVSCAFFRARRNLDTYSSNAPLPRIAGQAIGIIVSSWLKSDRATRRIKISLNKPFAIEVIILICWSIWTQKNGWLFQNKEPSVQDCISVFKSELALVIHRDKKTWVPDLQLWLSNLI